MQSFPVQVIVFVHARSPRQLTLHVPASHSIVPVHVSGSLQPTVQVDPLQVIDPLQLRLSTHVISHRVDFEQSMLPAHESAFGQRTLHGIPAGQTTSPHAPGQTMLQPPSTQVPPSGQTSSHFGGGGGAASSLLASSGPSIVPDSDEPSGAPSMPPSLSGELERLPARSRPHAAKIESAPIARPAIRRARRFMTDRGDRRASSPGSRHECDPFAPCARGPRTASSSLRAMRRPHGGASRCRPRS